MCTTCAPSPLLTNVPGGWRSSAPASVPGFPRLRFRRHSGKSSLYRPGCPTHGRRCPSVLDHGRHCTNSSASTNRECTTNPFPCDICSTSDENVAGSSNPRVIMWKATQTMATCRTIPNRSSAIGRVNTGRHMSPASIPSRLSANGDVHCTDTPHRRNYISALAKYPRTNRVGTWFPR